MLFFLALFLIVSPILILFSLGYKYNWQKNTLEKTGVFFIKSFPKDAEIFINDEKYKKETPTQITRLLPKNYNVRIQKEGYRSWQKNLEIYPQMTTFIEDVSLFKTEIKANLLLQGNFNIFKPSYNKQLIALLEDDGANNTIWIYNMLSDDFIELYKARANKDIEIISWSYTNRKLLIKENGKFLILNIGQPDYYIALSEITSLSMDQIKWHHLNDNLLIGENNSQLYRIDIISQETEKILDEYVLNYEQYKNDLFYIAQDLGTYYLKVLTGNQQETVFSIPYSTDYQFYKTKNNLVLFDASQKLVYLLDLANSQQPVSSVIKDVEDFKWHNNQLVYWNNSELWAYYPESEEEVLLERTSQKIKNGFWHPNSTHIFGVIGSKLKIYELDSRDQRNVYDFFDLEEGQENFISTNKKRDYLYLITSFNNQAGFYKVEIQ